PKTYDELMDAEKLQDDYDVRATNIILQCLPPELYSLVNHHEFKQGLSIVIIAKEKGIWQGCALSQRGQGTRHDYDEAPGAKAVLMANLSSYDSNVISGVPILETTQDNYVQEMYYFEQLAFDSASDIEITNPRVVENQDTQKIISHNAAFQTDDLDAFDSDCDEALGAKAVLMANLSIYDSNVIFEVPILETTQDNYVLDNCVQEMYYSEQLAFDPTLDIKITSDSNIISYAQYLNETESAAVQNIASSE
nr:hypothetical protein [Tanacetum cinerariifolium]